MILYIHDILCPNVYTLYHRSAWSGLSQAGSPLGGFEYSGAEAEQRTRRHPADQRRPQSVTAEVLSNIYSLYIQTLLHFVTQCGYVKVSVPASGRTSKA